MAQPPSSDPPRRLRALRADVTAAAAPRSSTVVLLAFAGLVLALAIVYADRPFGWGADDKRFAAVPAYKLWLLVVCAQVAGWAIAAILLRRAYASLWEHRHGHVREIATSVALLLVLMAAFSAAARRWGVGYGDVFSLSWKTLALTVLGALVALAAAVAIWLVHAALERLDEQVSTVQARIERFVELRDQIQWLLGILGAVLAGAILGAASLRRVVLGFDPGLSFPQQYVLLYGAFLSALIALCYAPSYVRVRAIARRLRADAIGPAPDPRGDEWSGWYERRGQLGELLGTDVSVVDSLKTGVAILGPVAAGLLGLLLPGAG